MVDDKSSEAIMGNDRDMVNIQSTLMGAISPISEILVTFRQIHDKRACSTGGSASLDFPGRKEIICLNQTNVHRNYFRRLPIATKLMGNPEKAQSLLKKNSKI